MNDSIAGHQQWCVPIRSLNIYYLIHFEQMKGDEYATLEKPPNHKLFPLTTSFSVLCYNIARMPQPRIVALQLPLLSSTSQ
jgi:hypothetical protein